MSEESLRAAILNQARYCENSGSPVTARVLRGLEQVIDRTTATGRRTLDWPGDPRGSGDSVPLRLAGGLHATARSGDDLALAAIYAGTLTDADVVARTLRTVLIARDATLVGWLDSPPQTNETGRSAAIMAGLLLLAADHQLPFELIELGASAGLNLNLDRFGYRLGETMAGDVASPLQLAPDWEGASPLSAPVRVVARRAVDQAPVDVRDPIQCARLAAYVWPDQPERLDRLAAALAIAATHPPLLARGDAVDFAAQVLVDPQEQGVMRVVFHTIFWTYLSAHAQALIIGSLDRAGALATPSRPLAWLRYELDGSGGVAELLLTRWPGGETRRLATGHPHVRSLRWLG